MGEKHQPATFVTHDARIKRGLQHPVDQEQQRLAAKGGPGLIPIDSDLELLEMAAAAADTFQYFKKHAVGMSKAQASFVRHARVDERRSWRSVAQAFHDEYGADWIQPHSNQLAGMALCEVAAFREGKNFMNGKEWNE